MKAALDAAIKHGAPRGSMELAKLAEAAEHHRKACEQVARMLRVMLVLAAEDVKPHETILRQGKEALDKLEELE